MFPSLVTVDELKLHFYASETKIQSTQWEHFFWSPSKKAKTGKAMLIVFLDCRRVILTDTFLAIVLSIARTTSACSSSYGKK